MSKEELESFKEEFLEKQKNLSGGRLIGKDALELLSEKYGKRYSKNHIYYVLKKMGLSYISGRSVHPKADKEAQESFKKSL